MNKSDNDKDEDGEITYWHISPLQLPLPLSPWLRRCILLALFFMHYPEVQKGVGSGQFLGNVFSKFCTALWALKQTGMSLNQGKVQGSLTEKAQFSFGYAGSFLRHWSWHHSIILFVGLSPGFHPSVTVLTSASSILAFKWSKGLASNSLHTKFATTSCIFQVNLNFAILHLSTLNPNIKMNCQTAMSYRGLRNDNKFEEGMIWASKQLWRVTLIARYFRPLGRRPWKLLATLCMSKMLDLSFSP